MLIKTLFLIRYFNNWHTYLHQQVDGKKISRSVFRPVQHYLAHIKFIIKRQGPLRAYSTRSMERSIGVFSKLIKSKREGGKNASNIIERLAIYNHVNCVLNIEKLVSLITPRQYTDASYMDHPNDVNGLQLWEPFLPIFELNDELLVEGVPGKRIKKAIKRFYTRSKSQPISTTTANSIVLASRLWASSTVYSSCMYRRLKKETSRGNQYIMFSCSDNA